MSTRVVNIGDVRVSVSTDGRASLRTLLRTIFERNETELKLTDAQISEIVSKNTGKDYPPRHVAVARFRFNSGGLGNPIPERPSVAYRG